MGTQHGKKQRRGLHIPPLSICIAIGLIVVLGLLTPVSAVSAPVTEVNLTAAPEIQYGKTNTGSVNVRTEPSTKAPKVTTLRKGVVFPILDSTLVGDDIWYQMELDDATAYIRGDLVELLDETDALALMESQQTKTVRSSSGNASGSSSAGTSPGTMVWLSATGSKYHSKNNCGNMNPEKARRVTLEEALSRGMGKCKTCH